MSEVTLRVESSVKAPRVSRSRLSHLQPQLEPRYDDVILVVSELVSNSVRHGSSDGINVTVASSGGWIRVEVTDDGPGFSIDAPRGDGLGLSIVEKLADRWGMKNANGSFTVWAELSAEPP